MKWIGQHIVDLIARFRSDVYLEDISTGTIASGGNLGLDSNNKVVKADEDGATLTTEAVQDIVGGMFSSNTETRVAATYVDGGDGAGKINVVVDDMTANTTYSIQDGELSQNNFTNADHTKLNGIEISATADQTKSDIDGLAITTVGALSSGTIASGFGNIDNGSSTLDTGAATLASLTCTAAGTFGGGYGSTGATISTAGVGEFNGALTTDATLTSKGTVLVNGHNATIGARILLREGTDNGTNHIGFRSPAALTSNVIFDLPDGDGSANQVLKTDGSGTLDWTTMSGGTVGWHGSGTRIKILPKDFVPNDGGRPVMIEDDSIGSNELFLFSHSSLDMFAYVHIPTGFKATHTRIYGSDTGQNFTTYEGDIDSKTIAVKGSATAIGTEKAITNVTSDTTNYLVIRVTSDGASDEIHGGYVTIVAV
jgi:X-X-X-Leu-X-X-Gly heptad repeat protein